MALIDTRKLSEREPKPGWHGRLFGSESMTFAHYAIDAGASLHEHSHPNEEVGSGQRAAFCVELSASDRGLIALEICNDGRAAAASAHADPLRRSLGEHPDRRRRDAARRPQQRRPIRLLGARRDQLRRRAWRAPSHYVLSRARPGARLHRARTTRLQLRRFRQQ
jgi:hypothetical protein